MKVLVFLTMCSASLIHSVNDHVLHQKLAIATLVLSSMSGLHLAKKIDAEVVRYFGAKHNVIRQDGSRGDIPVEQGAKVRRALLEVMPELIQIQESTGREPGLEEISRLFILDSERDDVRQIIARELHMNKRMRIIPEGHDSFFSCICSNVMEEINSRAPLELGDPSDFYSLESKRGRMLSLVDKTLRTVVREKLREAERDLSLEQLISSFDEDSCDDL